MTDSYKVKVKYGFFLSIPQTQNLPTSYTHYVLLKKIVYISLMFIMIKLSNT